MRFALLLLGVALLVFGTNLQGVLLPLRGHERGAGMVAIGLFSSSWSVGFVVACATVGAALGAMDHRRAFVGLATVSAIAALSFPALPHDGAWIGLRLLGGFCFGAASTIIECWLLEHGAGGVAFAGYMIANLVASLCGTLSLDIVDPAGTVPFVLAASALAASALPVALGCRPGAAGAPPPPFRPRVAVLLRASPDAVAGCCLAGVITGALGGLGPLFGMTVGLDMRGITLMLAANVVGGAVAYAPIGMLSERLDRRLLMGALAGVGALVCVPLALFAPTLGRGAVVALLFLFGLVQYPLYGLGIGLANAHADGRDKAEIASEALLLFGAGTIAGPLLGAAAMRIAPQDLFVLIALLLLALLAVVSRTPFARTRAIGRGSGTGSRAHDTRSAHRAADPPRRGS